MDNIYSLSELIQPVFDYRMELKKQNMPVHVISINLCPNCCNNINSHLYSREKFTCPTVVGFRVHIVPDHRECLICYSNRG